VKITHIAIWTKNLENLKEFYLKYFRGKSNGKYKNIEKGFESYFISFDEGVKLELMNRIDISDVKNSVNKEYIGISHFAFSVGSKKKVEELTEILRKDGYLIIGEPRITGDGFYESVILDPDKNRIEITE
jgi:lactoylglutathione lyase